MLSVLRQRNFALLWWSAFISGIGNFVFIAALPYFVYSISGSTLASGSALISEMVPTAVFSAVGGVYADRWRRKPVLIASDWLRGLILLPLILVHSTSTLWIVYVTAFLGATVANFAGPFGSAAVPHVVREDDLATANAAFSAGGWVSVLIGSPLGGILLRSGGLPAVVVVDALTFALSGLLVAGLNVGLEQRPAKSSSGPVARSPLTGAWSEWIDGLRFVLQQRWLSIFFLVMMLTFLANSISLVILAPFVRHVLGGSPQVYSWALTAQGLGGIMASAVSGPVLGRVSSATLLSWSILAFGMLQVVIAVGASVPLTLSGAFLGGLCVLFVVVTMNTVLQSRVPDMYRGRVFGSHRTTAALVGLMGSLMAGLMGDVLGIQITFGIGGAVFLAAGILSFIALVPAMQTAEPDASTV